MTGDFAWAPVVRTFVHSDKEVMDLEIASSDGRSEVLASERGRDALMDDLTAPRLGDERTAWQYPMGTLLRSGARLSFGSDWPVSSHLPLDGVRVAVTRTTLDRFGQAVTSFDAAGPLPSVQRNAQNLVTTATDARGHQTVYAYDSRGNTTRRTRRLA